MTDLKELAARLRKAKATFFDTNEGWTYRTSAEFSAAIAEATHTLDQLAETSAEQLQELADRTLVSNAALTGENMILSNRVAELEAKVRELTDDLAETERAYKQFQTANTEISNQFFAMQSRIAELEARQILDGWVAVPREPTEEMLNHARWAEFDNQGGTDEVSDETIIGVWNELIAAAPKKENEK